MKKFVALMCVIAFVIGIVGCAWGGVPIDATNFPDPAFRSHILATQDWDEEGIKGFLDDSEIMGCNGINVCNWGIHSLQGLDFFPYMTGFAAHNNYLTEFNVSNLPYLCDLHCGDNPNLSSVTLGSKPNLHILYMYNDDLCDIDLSQCPSLVTLCLGGNHFSEIDISNCPNLEELEMWNNSLTTLDLSSCTVLRRLNVDGNKLEALDVSPCPELSELRCSNNLLTELDITRNTALTMLTCFGNQLTNLDVSKNTALTTLECFANQLQSLDVTSNTALTELSCNENQLKVLNLNKNTAITKLQCYENQLTELDLSHNTSLTQVECHSQKRKGLKIKETSQGYKVSMKDYVSHPENIDADSISPQPISYNKTTGIVTFSEPIKELRYNYITHSPNNDLMDVTITNPMIISALERSGFNIDGLIISDMTENGYLNSNGNTLTESDISDLSYSDYGKLGFVADGNSRLIIRVQTDKPGTVSFSFNDDIGAKIESLTSRKELIALGQLNTTEINSDTHQVSAVLVAPERFPNTQKDFPSDTFSVHVKFTDEDGEVTEDDLELKIEVAPVILIPGMFDNAYKTFGIGSNSHANTGIYRELKSFGFDETHIHVWNDYDRSKSPNELLADINNGLFKKITEAFNQYASGGIVCTKADIVAHGVAHGMGGLMARRFLHEADKDFQDGNNWSMRSYKQGMVRRLITIATPHYGTPWADSINKRRSITMMYNGILNVPYFSEHPVITSVADSIFLIRMCSLLVNTLIPSPQLTKNSHIFLGSAWEEMKTTAARSYGFPAGVPMYAIYGNIIIDGVYRDSMNLIQKLVGKVLGWDKVIDIDIYNIPATALSWVEKKLTGSMKNSLALSVFSHLRDIPDYVRIGTDAFSRGLFGSEANDLIVSASSASGGLRSSEYVNTALDVMNPNPFDDKRDRYSHWAICKQLDVGEKVASLLKGAKNEFTVFDSEVYETANKSLRNSSVTLADEIDETEEFVFSERLNLNIEPSILNENNPQNVKFSVTADMSLQNDVYCIFGNDNGYRFFKMPHSDKNGRKFDVEFNAEDIFMSMDKGAIEILCMSCISDDSGISGMYTSNTAYITSLTNLDSTKIIRLDFAGASTIYTSVNSEIPAGLFAVDSDGRYYDVSSPLNGTQWTSDEIARVNDNGCVFGLKEGSTVLTATFNGLTASVNVEVSAALIKEEENTPPEITTETLSNAVTSQPYSLQLKASGTTPITWTYAGKLPAGLTLSESGLISGTPTKTGKSTFTVTAQNDYGKTSQKYTLQVFAPVSITTASLKVGTIGKSYSVTMRAKGTKTITWTAEGLPNGLTMNAKGKISGKPTVYGMFNVKVKAENGAGSVTKNLTLEIKAIAPKLSGSLKKATLNESYSSGLKVTGSAPITWSVEGNLPDGLTLDASTGIISGIPTSYAKSGYKITLTATNDGGSKSKKITLKVNGKAPKITAKLPQATAGENYSAELSATGSEPITFTADLPEYLTLDGKTITGNIPESAKNFKVKVYASNPVKTVCKTYTVKVITKKKSVSEIYKAEKGTDITKNDVITGMPTKPEKDTEINSGYIIVAVLGEVSRDVSGMYDFSVELPDYIVEGSELVYLANSDKPSEDDDIAEFYDDTGAEISAVPENRRITVSIWLNPETVYYPVIAVKD
ncbi:MAG: putative Ig domain-containing protein, partial [Synergistaceae bacterium]|nr:putative Ig domain-containing protein [Synergistaceae bacterium]